MSETGDAPPAMSGGASASREGAAPMRRPKNEPPCRTLLICDLAEAVTPESVTKYFETICPDGYMSNRVRKDRNGAMISFVDYESVEKAIQAYEAGTVSEELLNGSKPAFYYARSPTNNVQPPGGGRPIKRTYEDSFGVDGPGPRRPAPNARGTSNYPASGGGYAGGGGPGYGAPPPEEAWRREPTLAEATSATIFVDNVPPDASLREVGHIFRQFPGFKSLRMKPPREGTTRGPFCFVEFEAPPHALVALRACNGYRFDHREEFAANCPRLRLEFAKAQSSRPA